MLLLYSCLAVFTRFTLWAPIIPIWLMRRWACSVMASLLRSPRCDGKTFGRLAYTRLRDGVLPRLRCARTLVRFDGNLLHSLKAPVSVDPEPRCRAAAETTVVSWLTLSGRWAAISASWCLSRGPSFPSVHNLHTQSTSVLLPFVHYCIRKVRSIHSKHNHLSKTAESRQTCGAHHIL